MELLASSMHNLALALGATNPRAHQRVPPVNETTINISGPASQPVTSAYTRPNSIPTGLKALRIPLSERIGARISPYERSQSRGGARIREWKEGGKGKGRDPKEGTGIQGKEAKDGKEGKGATNSHEGSPEVSAGPSGECGDSEMGGGTTSADPDLPEGSDYIRTLQSPDEEAIDEDDWDWEKFANSKAD
ncbi:unnamed protein product [Rhizoctonia solani]|uniref:Uncharacterized protein n=2 Tax=Rhizoctonia solani TaxID=456999 RepID=A0A8H3AWX6_9AGAM|nr:unnamed protein product [Rhizoctonia solani]